MQALEAAVEFGGSAHLGVVREGGESALVDGKSAGGDFNGVVKVAVGRCIRCGGRIDEGCSEYSNATEGGGAQGSVALGQSKMRDRFHMCEAVDVVCYAFDQ